MKISLFVFFLFAGISQAKAIEVCRIQSSYGSQTEDIVQCTSRAICTTTADNTEAVGTLKIGFENFGCAVAEAKVIKKLLASGYQVKTDTMLLKN